MTFGPISQPRGGIAVRSNVAARSFERLGAALTVASTGEDGHDCQWRCVEPSRTPRFGCSVEFIRLIARELTVCDVVVFESALFLPALVSAMALSRSRPKLVWDTTELETLHYSRLGRAPGVLARLAIWWGLETVGSLVSDAVIAISEEEATHWRRMFPAARQKTYCVPHAPISPAAGAEPSETPEPAGGLPVAVYVGNAEAKQNAASAEWICTTLAPRLVGKATVVLAGARTDEIAKACAAPDNVEALGFVDDIDAVFARAKIALAPVSAAAGVKTKVLQYLAYALPVVGTPLAFEGISGAPGVVVSELEGFPDAVLAALAKKESPEERARRVEAQRRFVEAGHGSEPVDAAWQSVFQAVLAKKAVAAS